MGFTVVNIDFVDVSVYQGDIDWAAVTVPAIIKATEGSTFTDPRFAQNRAGARSAGKCMGFYHFLASTSNGVAQAHHFLNVVHPGPDELLCLDWETDSVGVRPDPNQAKDWIDTVRSLGYLNVRLYGNEWLAAYALQWEVPFWCAWYGDAEQQVLDRHAVAWQWSSEEFVPGIPSRVDVNQVLDPEGWYADMALSDEDVTRIAEAVWSRIIDAADWSAPAGNFFGALRDEVTRDDKLTQRVSEATAALIPPTGTGGPLTINLTGTATTA